MLVELTSIVLGVTPPSLPVPVYSQVQTQDETSHRGSGRRDLDQQAIKPIQPQPDSCTTTDNRPGCGVHDDRDWEVVEVTFAASEPYVPPVEDGPERSQGSGTR